MFDTTDDDDYYIDFYKTVNPPHKFEISLNDAKVKHDLTAPSVLGQTLYTGATVQNGAGTTGVFVSVSPADVAWVCWYGPDFESRLRTMYERAGWLRGYEIGAML